MNSDQIYEMLRADLKKIVDMHNLHHEKISIKYRSLTAEEAIGAPVDQDYPIIKGKEKMVEACFRTGRGQAFTDEFGDGVLSVEDMLYSNLNSNRKRAYFIAAFNAIYRHFELCDKTIHCKDEEPIECGKALLDEINREDKVLLVGLQPRLLQSLAERGQNIRVIDMDQDSVGKYKFGIVVEDAAVTGNAIDWCDIILVTGSTIVNKTMPTFINSGKPCLFFGITASAPAKVLGLNTFCAKGK